MVLRAVNTEPQGTFGLLLNPQEFEQTLEGMLEEMLQLSR